MPTTVNSDLIIYDDLAQTAFLERRQDNLEVFNAASNGAIILDNELIEGDFRKRTFYKVGGSIESRNVNSTDPVTGKKIGAGESVSVKAPWKYGPYETTEEAFKRRGRDVSEFSEVIGVDVADATLEGYIKYALQGLVAAIGANADMTVSADIATDGKKTLTRGLRKYGDKFNRVALFVMHSTTYFDIVDQAIDNREFNSEVQHPPNQATCRSSSNTICGCLKSKHLRGLRLSRRSKADNSSGLSWLRSLPLGTYCRNKPLLFSFRPRSHALYGCAK